MQAKFLRGKSANISTDTTPFSDGALLLTTDDGFIYADALVGDQMELARRKAAEHQQKQHDHLGDHITHGSRPRSSSVAWK